MTEKIAWRALLLLATLTGIACGELPSKPVTPPASSEMSTTHQEVNSTNRVLILGSSVSDGLSSREAQAVAAIDPSAQIDVATPEQWSALTAEQFMSYRALIIGDGECLTGTLPFQAAVDTRNTWGAIVDGNVAILGTDPTHNRTPELVESSLRFVLDSTWHRTGMYIALGCAYQDAPADTAVTLLEPFGTFTVQGVPGCADTAHMPQMYPDDMSRDLFDGVLSGDGCAARSVFTQYPDHNFAFAGLAMNSSGDPVPAQSSYSDVFVDPGNETLYESTPYILVRGATAQSSGCGTPETTAAEQCDLGDGLNGFPALDGQQPTDTCSWSCKLHWCGDGYTDKDLGEECDLGINNGRSDDAYGSIGTCTASCKLTTAAPAPTQPPTALCQNVTVVASDTCGASASIDNGSSDPDNDLVGCTQSPAGPYEVGSTTVTLTCTDQAAHTASCTGVVTVLDQAPPSLTLNGPASATLACGATYTDPGATATDTCSGDLTASITTTGTVDTSTAGQYTVTYTVTDPSGNVSTAVRQLTVGPCSTCTSIHLSDYTLFLQEDYTNGHDMEGKVAAGGNITLSDFSMGSGLPDSNISQALVAGGNLSLLRGGVWGDAWYGGTFSADTTVVYPRGTVRHGTPIDFAARFAELRALSAKLAGMTANGSATRANWGGVMLHGTNPTLNVFNVNASDFTGAVLFSIDAPAGSLAVVNIRGASATFTGFGTSFSGGIDQHGVLYNFVDTTSINAHGYGFWGTLLAPYARVSFSEGSWNGGLYALSLDGNAEGHYDPMPDRELCP